jgi:uncharacterized protein YcfJ
MNTTNGFGSSSSTWDPYGRKKWSPFKMEETSVADQKASVSTAPVVLKTPASFGTNFDTNFGSKSLLKFDKSLTEIPPLSGKPNNQFGGGFLLKSKSDAMPSMTADKASSGGGAGAAGAALSTGISMAGSLIAADGANDLARSAPMVGEYGTQSVDIDKLGAKATKDSAVTGMTTGATIGGTVGTAAFGAVGTIVGTALGALVGGAIGWMGGNKKAARVKKEAWNDFRKQELVAKNKKNRELNRTQYNSLYGAGTGTAPVMAKSGMRVKANLIAYGSLHRENNNLGNRDKGLPVINNSGRKLIEIEREEWILNPEATESITNMATEYERTNNPDLLVKIGKRTAKELLDKTDDKSKRFLK